MRARATPPQRLYFGAGGASMVRAGFARAGEDH
jgi:hypothetical protein